MNERIIYEDETVKEEVYEGTLILDGHMSETEQRKHIFDMMRKDGIEVKNEDEYSIGYVGADDNDGISETQTSKFVVTRTYTKQVPYKITTEEIYSGEYILDGLRKTEEEQRKEIFNMMRKDGIDVSNEDELTIGYEGADDNDGLSETQTSKFVVYREKKEKAEQDLDELQNDVALTEDTKIRKLYDELITLRERASNTNSIDEMRQIYERMNEVLSLLDDLVDNSTKNYGAFEEALNDIDKEIFAVEELYNENIKEYENLFNEMKKIMQKQGESFTDGSLVTQEEADKYNNEFIDKQKSCNDRSLKIKKIIDAQHKDLEELYKKREKISNDLNTARSLGISAIEFIEITDKLNRRDIIEAVIERRGLADIISTNSKNRTPEERQKLKDARDEVIELVEQAKKLKEVDSVLNNIEALLANDLTAELNGKRRVLIVKPNSLDAIHNNVLALPEKVFRNEEIAPSYVPGDAPKDMEAVLERVKEDAAEEEIVPSTSTEIAIREDVYSPSTEIAVRNEDILKSFTTKNNTEINIEGNDENKFVIYKDESETPRYYAGETVFNRFEADKVGGEILINGDICYEIYPEDAEYIISNANNKYSPYIINIETVNISNTDDMLLTDKFVLYKDIDNQDRLYARKNVFERFDKDAIGEGVRINGALCYEMSGEDAEEIVSNANNDYSPYIVSFEVAELEPEIENNQVSEEATKVEETPAEEVKEPAAPDVEIPVVQEDAVTTPTEEPRGLTDKFVLYRESDEASKVYAKKAVFTRFGLEQIGEPVRINGALCYEMSGEDVQEMVRSADNDYSPYIVVFENAEVLPENQIEAEAQKEKVKTPSKAAQGIIDKYTLFREPSNPNKSYANEELFKSFGLDPIGEPVKINDELCYEIDNGDVQDLIRNGYNDYSPYDVVFEDAEVVREEKEEADKDNTDEKVKSQALAVIPENVINNNNKQSSQTPKDAQEIAEEPPMVPITPATPKKKKKKQAEPKQAPSDSHKNFTDIDLDDVFAPDESTITPPKPSKHQEPVQQPTQQAPAQQQPAPQPPVTPPNTNTPPIGNPQPPVSTGQQPTDNTNGGAGTQDEHEIKEEIITLYRDIANNNQVYASDEVVHKFGIPVSTPAVKIEGHDCYKISKDTDQIINSIAKMSRDPKFVVRYKNVELEKEKVVPRPHVEEIIAKLTEGLDIRARDCDRYTASNLKIAKNFKNELSSGNVAYNIVHVVPATIKAGVNVARKIANKLLVTDRAKRSISKIKTRLDNLSELELEVLFEEYKGSQLKTDMNTQINPLILDRVREYGLSKVETLNDQIKENYTILFTILGEVRVIEDKLADENLGEAEAQMLEDERTQLIAVASDNIRTIIDARNKANNLLSSGVHGIEEDFKAVSTRLSYVGMRFAKKNDFNNKLQQRLGNFGRNLNVALSADNKEAIVQNFMGLESCYYENTEIRGSLVGRRSVGSKYYTPMAEQFDYRDDPFIRDLFTTVAVTSATVSAINAARVHQIESQQILSDQKAQADTINAQNDATMDYVHQTGQEIAGKRDTFAQGMEAQAHQTVLNDANAIERATLDVHNWKFGSAYRATDHAGHEAYNQFHVDVTNQINSVTSQYASGAITSAEALERMAQISNGAQDTLNEVVSSSLDIIRDYAATHPQFDLRAVEESMEYIAAHPEAIANMNQAMTDVTNLAEGLTTLQASHMEALTSLPSDMASTIVCAASSTLLAMNVCNSMNKKHNKKGQYGDEITSMMEEYLSEDEDQDTTQRSK